MAQRRPITSHPGFVPLVALWFAALLGLVVAVLPAAQLARLFAAIGLGGFDPLEPAGRIGASGAAALLGAALGFMLALPLARRSRRDPRPVYAEPEAGFEEPAMEPPLRRPLRVREELAEGLADAGDEPRNAGGGGELPAFAAQSAGQSPAQSPALRPVALAEAEEGFMILTPQPAHPPRPPLDLDALLAQFDNALAAFRADDETGQPAASQGPDPVHAFVARQTGSPVPQAAPSPLGGRMPDHQAELRAALDKLARAHRPD